MQAVVAERLSVRLEPVDLRIAPPDAQEFHDSLQRLFTEGGALACMWICRPARLLVFELALVLLLCRC